MLNEKSYHFLAEINQLIDKQRKWKKNHLKKLSSRCSKRKVCSLTPQINKLYLLHTQWAKIKKKSRPKNWYFFFLLKENIQKQISIINWNLIFLLVCIFYKISALLWDKSCKMGVLECYYIIVRWKRPIVSHHTFWIVLMIILAYFNRVFEFHCILKKKKKRS